VSLQNDLHSTRSVSSATSSSSLWTFAKIPTGYYRPIPRSFCKVERFITWRFSGVYARTDNVLLNVPFGVICKFWLAFLTFFLLKSSLGPGFRLGCPSVTAFQSIRTKYYNHLAPGSGSLTAWAR
jgi:hypothetical protein